MAYKLKSKKGLAIKKDGDPVYASDCSIKILEHDEKNKSFIFSLFQVYLNKL